MAAFCFFIVTRFLKQFHQNLQKQDRQDSDDQRPYDRDAVFHHQRTADVITEDAAECGDDAKQ